MERDLPKIILLHGNNGGKEPGGTAQDYWFSHTQREFERSGLHVVAKNFPDPMIARMDIWLPFLKNECGADEHSILIGHSSGAIAAMRYAEKNRILGTVLVGAYYTDIGDEIERQSGYFDSPWNWSAIRNNQQWIIQFASIDDPFFPIEEPRFVSKQLQSEYHEFKNRGHFFETEFPELVETVKRKIF